MKIVLISAEWDKLIQIGWIIDPNKIQDCEIESEAECLYNKANTYLLDNANIKSGGSDYVEVSNKKIVAYIDYIAIPEKEDLQNLLDLDDLDDLRDAINNIQEYEEEIFLDKEDHIQDIIKVIKDMRGTK